MSDKYYEREDPHARKQRKLKQRILYFFATVGVLSIVGGTLYLTFGRHLIKKQKIDAFDKRLEKHKEKRTEAQSKTIGAVGTKFLNGKTLEEFIQCVRPLDGVEERIKKYLAANREKVNSWQFKQFNNTANLQGDVFFVGFEGENFPRNILPLEISKEGWRVDWDAFVISQEVEIADINNGLFEGTCTLRVLMRPLNKQARTFIAGTSFKDKGFHFTMTVDNFDETVKTFKKAKKKAFIIKVKVTPGLGPVFTPKIELVEILQEGWVRT